jgi:hypothetical protein
LTSLPCWFRAFMGVHCRWRWPVYLATSSLPLSMLWTTVDGSAPLWAFAVDYGGHRPVHRWLMIPSRLHPLWMDTFWISLVSLSRWKAKLSVVVLYCIVVTAVCKQVVIMINNTSRPTTNCNDVKHGVYHQVSERINWLSSQASWITNIQLRRLLSTLPAAENLG